VAPNAAVIGDVEIGRASSIWFGCTVRGDVNRIRIGVRSNLQDGTVVHVTHDGNPTLIGDEVTVGHGCIIHACTLEDRCFIGMGATVMDGVVVETGAMVAAGALVPPGKRIKSGELWVGVPARHVRAIPDEERASWPERVQLYVELAAEYRAAVAQQSARNSRGDPLL